MAKEKQEKASKAPVATTWREATVYRCPDCPFTHERKERVQQHINRGNHLHTESPAGASSEPETAAEAPVEAEAQAEGGKDA